MKREPFEIRMAHPFKNALDPDLIAWLDGELQKAGDRPILLTGTDNAFCAGLNLTCVERFDAGEMESFLRGLDTMLRRLFLHPAPTVAWINGHAIAGGSVIALACDARIVEDEPRIRVGLNEVALGACFPPVALAVVRARLPRRTVERVLLGAELFDPHAARELGLVDEVVQGAEARARSYLELLASHPARTYALTKRALRAPELEIDPETQRRFLEEEVPIWTSPEVKARVAAVLGR